MAELLHSAEAFTPLRNPRQQRVRHGIGPLIRAIVAASVVALAAPRVGAESLDGRWRLLAAEDLRDDGSVARYPWGPHPVGSIVVQDGACYLQIASGDVPAFTGSSTVTDQMKAALLSTYIAYSGPCTIDESERSVTLKVEAAWRPDYVGTVQKRFFRFENGRLLFGPAPHSITAGSEKLTRRLTLERAP